VCPSSSSSQSWIFFLRTSCLFSCLQHSLKVLLLLNLMRLLKYVLLQLWCGLSGSKAAHVLATAGRPTGRGSSPVRVKIFSLLQVVQTSSGVHPLSHPMCIGVPFPGAKRQGREADHSPPTSTEVKKMLIYAFTSPYAIMT
jgi:hypothetical protein